MCFIRYEDLDSDNNLTKGWVITKLGNLIKPSKERFQPTNSDNRTFLGLEHIESNSGKITGSDNSKDTVSMKTIFRKNDVLYGRLRPYLNKVCVASFDGVCSTDILVFPEQSNLSNKYLAYFLLTTKFVSFANRNSRGVQHPRIKFDVIAKFDIPLPPLAEQHRIVTKIESIFAQIDAIRENLEMLALQTSSASRSLRQFKNSVLKQAFEGKLVPQDPKDEPAEAVLNRTSQRLCQKYGS